MTNSNEIGTGVDKNRIFEGISNEELIKTSRARSIRVLDEVMVKLKIEYAVLVDEIEKAGPAASRSLRFKKKVAEYWIDRLEKQARVITKRTFKQMEERKQKQERLQVFEELLRQRYPLAFKKEEVKAEPHKIVIDDPVADKALENIKVNVLAGMSLQENAERTKAVQGMMDKDPRYKMHSGLVWDAEGNVKDISAEIRKEKEAEYDKLKLAESEQRELSEREKAHLVNITPRDPQAAEDLINAFADGEL